MKRATDLVLAAALTITCASNAQDDPPSSQIRQQQYSPRLNFGKLRKRTRTEEILTIRMSNEGKASVNLPQPEQLCSNSLDGFVMVYRHQPGMASVPHCPLRLLGVRHYDAHVVLDA